MSERDQLDPSSEEFFESLYRADPDPWNFAGDPYERERFAATLEAVGPGPFRRVLEPGCSTGEITCLLAGRSEAVVAMDIAPSAVARARTRCQGLVHVEIRHTGLPAAIEGTFDLVVFSEIGYYFQAGPLADVVDALVERLDIGGRFVSVHWTGTSADHVLTGEEVQRIVAARPGLAARSQGGQPGFDIATFERTAP